MKHILVVDDVSTNLKYIGMILRDRYEVTMLKSGWEAVTYLNHRIPDLILLDIRMQEMNGYEVLEHLQKNPVTAKIPVILVTAEYGEESRAKGMAMGAVDIIHKPFEPQVLLERIEAVWKEEG